MLIQLGVKGGRGARPTWCIEKQAVGGWLNHISHRRVRSEVAPNLLKLQHSLLKVADNLLFDDTTLPAHTPTPTIQELAQDVAALKSYALALETALGDIRSRIRRLESDDEE